VRKYCPTGGCPDCLENYLSGDVMSRLTDSFQGSRVLSAAPKIAQIGGRI